MTLIKTKSWAYTVCEEIFTKYQESTLRVEPFCGNDSEKWRYAIAAFTLMRYIQMMERDGPYVLNKKIREKIYEQVKRSHENGKEFCNAKRKLEHANVNFTASQLVEALNYLSAKEKETV